MKYSQKVPGEKKGSYSFLKAVQVQMLNLCACQDRKSCQTECATLDPILTTPFFDAIR